MRLSRSRNYSLLAREINWLETLEKQKQLEKQKDSLLAREINWLETLPSEWTSWRRSPSSLLAREINWLETTNTDTVQQILTELDSLLAREINWLETQLILNQLELILILPTR